jgi:hypothetical protein
MLIFDAPTALLAHYPSLEDQLFLIGLGVCVGGGGGVLFSSVIVDWTITRIFPTSALEAPELFSLYLFFLSWIWSWSSLCNIIISAFTS